jgi:hypothetical protein
MGIWLKYVSPTWHEIWVCQNIGIFLPSVSGPSIGRLMINQLIDHYILEGWHKIRVVVFFCLNSRWKWDRAKSGWIPLLKNLCGWYRPFRSLGGEIDYETETDGLSIWLAPCHFGFLWDVDMFLRSGSSRMESRLPAGNLPSNLRMGRPLLLQESSSCDKTWAPCKSAEPLMAGMLEHAHPRPRQLVSSH